MSTNIAYIGGTGSGKTIAAQNKAKKFIEESKRIIVIDNAMAWLKFHSQSNFSLISIVVNDFIENNSLNKDGILKLGSDIIQSQESYIINTAGISNEYRKKFYCDLLQSLHLQNIAKSLHTKNKSSINLIIDSICEFRSDDSDLSELIHSMAENKSHFNLILTSQRKSKIIERSFTSSEIIKTIRA